MPTFFARRYVRRIEAVSRTEKTVALVILLLTAGIVAAFVLQVATDRDYLFAVSDSAGEAAGGVTAAEASPFPAAGLADWHPPQRVERFSADTLHVKIDGRAEAYLKYDCAGLTFGTYRHESDAQGTIDAYWYDMGTPANALGMFRDEQPAEASAVAVGRGGYQAGGAVFFWKGSSYVQVLPGRPAEPDARAALMIAERIAERIEDE